MDIYMRGKKYTMLILCTVSDMYLLICYLVKDCFRCLCLQLKRFKCFTELHFLPDCVNIFLEGSSVLSKSDMSVSGSILHLDI